MNIDFSLLLNQPFFNSARRPWLHLLLPRVKEHSNEMFRNKIGWRWNNESDLIKLGNSFGIINPKLYLLEDPEEEKEHLILFGLFCEKEIKCGCFSITFLYDKKNNLIAHLSHICFDSQMVSVHGIANSLLLFLENQIYPFVPVKKETLKADYLGRYIWAKLNFKFAENYWLKEPGGKALKLWELGKHNLERFLKQENIDMKELVLIRNGQIESLDLSLLRNPIEFASIKHKNGIKIDIKALDGDKYLLPFEKMDIGKAFMLGSYIRGDNYIISMSRAKLSNIHMPYWNGFRDV